MVDRKLAGLLFASLFPLLLCGCKPGQTRLTIRGGPSLDSLFSDLVKRYQEQHPEVTVITDFTCPPCVLFKRPGMEANFDLFVSLGQFELDHLSRNGQIAFGQSGEIGYTSLALVTSSRVKAPVRSIADLHKPGLRRIGVGDPTQVGVGYYAKQALSKAGLWQELQPRFVYTQSGCELLKWLSLGRDIDAAIVWSLCLGEEPGSIKSVVVFPKEMSPPVPVLLGIPASATNAPEARRFIEFARSTAARDLMEKHRIQPVTSL